MIFIKLFITFFEIGLFGFGGSYGVLSLIQTEVVRNNEWLNSAEFTNVVAISQLAPGSVSLNTATYCGYAVAHNYGFGQAMSLFGGVIATLAMVLPTFILIVLIAKMLMNHMRSQAVKSVLSGLRLAVVGLLVAATLMLMNTENFGSFTTNKWQFFISIFLFIATFVGTKIYKISSIHMILYSAFAGLMLF